jgi:hypothetical protein
MRERKHVALKTLAATVCVAAVCLISAVSVAVAGGGGSATAAATGSAWISASPNPAAAGGARVDLTGCGYASGPVEVHVVHSAGYTQTFFVGMWSTGCMDAAYFTTSEAGTYRIEAYQRSSSKRNATMVLKATTTLTVT